MQSTGQTSTQALSFTLMQGSAITYAIVNSSAGAKPPEVRCSCPEASARPGTPGALHSRGGADGPVALPEGGESRLDRVLSEDRAMGLDRRQLQFGHDVSVLDLARLFDRPARRRPETVQQLRDAPEVATDDVILLTREARELLAAHPSRLEG